MYMSHALMEPLVHTDGDIAFIAVYHTLVTWQQWSMTSTVYTMHVHRQLADQDQAESDTCMQLQELP